MREKKATAPLPTVTAARQPLSTPSGRLDFSVKTLEQIRAEKKKMKSKKQSGEDNTIGCEEYGATKVESSVKKNEQDEDKAAMNVPASKTEDRAALNEVTETISSAELSRSTLGKRKLVIKRSSLRKNAESAEYAATVDSHQKRKRLEQSDEPASSEKNQRNPQLPTSLTKEQHSPFFDATCIDKSVPLPDNLKIQTKKSNKQVQKMGSTDLSSLVDSERKEASVSAQNTTPTATTATRRKASVIKLKRTSTELSTEKLTDPEVKKKEAISGEVDDVDASLLLSPLVESKVLGGFGEGVSAEKREKGGDGAAVERRKSIAEMKAEM